MSGNESWANARTIGREHASLCQNLALLGKLQEGQKLRLDEHGDLAIDTSWIPFLERSYWKVFASLPEQSRKATKEAVESILERGQQCLRTLLLAYTNLRETAYKGKDVRSFPKPDQAAYEMELLIRHRVRMLYVHMQDAVPGLKRLHRTYSFDTAYSVRFKQIADDADAFLVGYNSMWTYQHELLKLHATPFYSGLGSTEDVRWGGKEIASTFPPSAVARQPILVGNQFHALGKPPPFAGTRQDQAPFGGAHELYVPTMDVEEARG